MKTSFLSKKLDERKQKHQYRQLRQSSAPDILLNFSSNNSLGLADHPLLKQYAIEYAEKYGTGATASRLICGNHRYHEDVEEELATLLGTEAALLFNCGFQANLTILASLADRRTLILLDRDSHNSLLQGAMLSRAIVVRYHHQNLDHLEHLLKESDKQCYSRKIIVTETIFSMDGSCSHIDKLIDLSKQADALLYLDDAHAISVAGTRGMGLAAGKTDVDIIVGGFGKGAGAFGAYVGCSSEMKEYLINFCPGLIYSTAPPPAVVGAIKGALQIIPTLTNERADLQANSEYLLNQLKKLEFNTGGSSSHIIPIILGSDVLTLSLAKWLEDRGILAIAIRPPTVSSNSSRLRLSLSTLHSRADLDMLTDHLLRWKNEKRVDSSTWLGMGEGMLEELARDC